MQAKLYAYIGAAFLEWLELMRKDRSPQHLPDHLLIVCDMKNCNRSADYYGYHRMLDGTVEPANVCNDHYNTLVYSS